MVTILAPTSIPVLYKIKNEQKKERAAQVDSREQHIAQRTQIYGVLTVE